MPSGSEKLHNGCICMSSDFRNKISIFIEVSAIQLSNISIHRKDIYIRYTFSSNFDAFINCSELFYTVERRDLSIRGPTFYQTDVLPEKL